VKSLHEHSYEHLWETFVVDHQLTPVQTQQFEHYINILDAWNQKMNITRITSKQEVLWYHLQDSLMLDNYLDIASRSGVADVGSGGGFPGIPLKIKYPELPVVLIEVNSKKITFLEAVIKELGLVGIEVNPLDWRTFLRTTEYNIDLFCSRASLHPDELIRMFQPSCFYRYATLVYWASNNWQPEGPEKQFLQAEESYAVGDRERKYAFFATPEIIEQV
jgi:16S rRNA (guanine527-N7)-methyltransferase